jgi:hypothetical protein
LAFGQHLQNLVLARGQLLERLWEEQFAAGELLEEPAGDLPAQVDFPPTLLRAAANSAVAARLSR